MSDNAKLDYISHRLDTVAEKVDYIGTSLTSYMARFDAHIERSTEEREQLQRNTDVLLSNTSSLQDHMQRTDLLETYVKKIDERFTPVEMEIIRKKAVADWAKSKLVLLAKIGGAIGGVGAIGAIVKTLIHYL